MHLLEVLERVLNKGIVIDGWGQVLLGGIPLLAVQMHVVVCSIDTYLTHRALAARPSEPDQLTGPEGELRDVNAGLPAPEAVVRAVEEYLRRLRPPEP